MAEVSSWMEPNGAQWSPMEPASAFQPLSASFSFFQLLSACQAFVQASVYHCLKIILRSCHNLCLHSLALLSNVAGSDNGASYRGKFEHPLQQSTKQIYLQPRPVSAAILGDSMILLLARFRLPLFSINLRLN